MFSPHCAHWIRFFKDQALCLRSVLSVCLLLITREPVPPRFPVAQHGKLNARAAGYLTEPRSQRIFCQGMVDRLDGSALEGHFCRESRSRDPWQEISVAIGLMPSFGTKPGRRHFTFMRLAPLLGAMPSDL
jgi:hypothetical protein